MSGRSPSGGGRRVPLEFTSRGGHVGGGSGLPAAAGRSACHARRRARRPRGHRGRRADRRRAARSSRTIAGRSRPTRRPIRSMARAGVTDSAGPDTVAVGVGRGSDRTLGRLADGHERGTPAARCRRSSRSSRPRRRCRRRSLGTARTRQSASIPGSAGERLPAACLLARAARPGDRAPPEQRPERDAHALVGAHAAAAPRVDAAIGGPSSRSPGPIARSRCASTSIGSRVPGREARSAPDHGPRASAPR